jgi:hypothetical protein
MMERFKVTSKGREVLQGFKKDFKQMPTADLLAKQSYDPSEVAYESKLDNQSKMFIDDIIPVKVR